VSAHQRHSTTFNVSFYSCSCGALASANGFAYFFNSRCLGLLLLVFQRTPACTS
jgi:hypothetical protein